MKKLSWLLATSFLYTPAYSADIKDHLPQGIDFEVKSKPLEKEKRDKLLKLGVSQSSIDLYGDLYTGGYGTEDFRWGDLNPHQLGSSPIDPKTYDLTGMKKFKALPPNGVHPRLLFSEADRAEHLKRLTTTKGGIEAMKVVNAYSAHLHGTYDKTADYAKPDFWKGSFGTNGFLELFRAHRDGWESRSKGESKGRLSPGLCVIEAYRAWLYEDAAAMKKVITAYETLINDALQKAQKANDPKFLKAMGGFNTSYFYDISFNSLSEEQKKLFRSMIISSWYKNDNYGMFQNAESTTSNWTTFGYQFFGRLGIEGDPGYNEIAYEGLSLIHI